MSVKISFKVAAIVSLLSLATSSALWSSSPQAASIKSGIDRTNYVLGTQNIGARYHFTDKPIVIEGAEEILKMGSNILKMRLGPQYELYTEGSKGDKAIKSLTDLVQNEPTYKQALDMPFAYYFLWTYCFSTDKHVLPWHGHMAPDVLAKEYREIYDLTKYLLATYNGTGKTFYLGNWEGDWHLLSGSPDKNKKKWERVPSSDAATGMIDWLNTRQRAVDDAKRDTLHHDVEVYHYLEVNLVQRAIKGEAAVVKDVLPQTNVDFVSYSSYDSLKKDIYGDLTQALNYIESQLPPKSGISGKRVFIGEYGFPADEAGKGDQDRLSREVMTTGLKWGCPFILYWELYNNELSTNGKGRGFWLINQEGEKQPIYFTHQEYYQQLIKYLKDKGNAGLPDEKMIRAQALKVLEKMDPSNVRK
jgi:hypothetical protein